MHFCEWQLLSLYIATSSITILSISEQYSITRRYVHWNYYFRKIDREVPEVKWVEEVLPYAITDQIKS
jgi:hypothetical protein